jgi:pimeloyl-ACP methyl ester carboxylesterase
VTGRAVDGASHFVPEDAPDEVAAELLEFFG